MDQRFSYGFTYKPNVDDMRESPTHELMHLLEESRRVAFYDSYIPTIPPTREHAEYTGKYSVEWDQATIGDFDAVLIATNHSDINYQELADWSDCVIDTRNAMKGIPPDRSITSLKLRCYATDSNHPLFEALP